MERIKQALDLAQRQGASTYQAKPSVRSPEPAHTGRVQSGEVAVTYTETRGITVSPDVMERNRLITGTGKDDVTSSYKLLRTQVLQRLTDNHWSALAVVSAKPAEGRTLTAINLAISLAQEMTHTVLLVDLDLHSPSIHRYFEFQPRVGLSDYLVDAVPLKDTLVNPGIDRLVVLPGGRPLMNSSEMLSTPRISGLVDELKGRYPSRIILFDLPPLLTTDDALAFSPLVDAALIVVEDGRSPRDEMQRAMAMLQATPVIGAVLNKYNGNNTRG